MINRFRKASVVNTNTITIWFFLYKKGVLPKASCRYISPCCSLIFFFFWTYSRESLAHLPSASLGERGFVLLYAKPSTPLMCSSHPWRQMKWQAAAVRGCNTFWYEVYHQVLFPSSPLKIIKRMTLVAWWDRRPRLYLLNFRTDWKVLLRWHSYCWGSNTSCLERDYRLRKPNGASPVVIVLCSRDMFIPSIGKPNLMSGSAPKYSS